MKLIGEVVADKMNKSRRVKVDEVRVHSLYKKRYRVSKTILAHDEKNEYQVGDVVEIVPARSKSKNKAWEIVRKVK